MHILKLDLGDKSYPIYIGSNILKKEIITKHIFAKQVMIVSNTTVAPLYIDIILSLLKDYTVSKCIVADGEQYKTLETANIIYTALLKAQFNRNVTLIALGGGVIGDIVGFVASSYQRGVRFINIPTTLLSQVDSSVGGKTGVNHELGKNMIGAFHQPQAVLIDITTLNTLSTREFNSGMAEVIKYGLIAAEDFFTFIRKNIDNIKKQPQLIEKIIYRSCSIKADIVAKDEYDNNTRMLLNLGHTFGHAIENLLGYGKYLHGEAVAIGIAMAAYLSFLENNINKKQLTAITNILINNNLPTTINAKIATNDFINTMMVDKKFDNNIRLILIKKIGNAYLSNDYNIDNLHKVIKKFCNNLT